MTASSTLRFGVAGYPIAHSKSPQMHMAAYAELGIDADYQRLPIPPELFEETVRALPGSGFSGINVTIPHKEAALAAADDASDLARAIGAANTLSFRDGKIFADNTDAPALVAALGELRAVFGARVLLLGAGGTARAAACALDEAGAEVSIWNRTAERAAKLAEEFSLTLLDTPGGGEGYDVIVNTTSVGMDAASNEAAALAALGLDGDAIGTESVIVDFVYRETQSPLAAFANARDLSLVDGPDLLARQAALSFAIWFNRPAPLAIMRAAL